MATTTTANPQAADAAPATSHRERLLAAAIECLRERGYARTTARDLVAASGTNLASIGYHFGSKENLLNEAIAQGFTAWTAEIERAAFADSEAGAIERLEISLEATIDRFEELRPFLVAFVEAFPQAVRTPELRERMAAAYEEVRITAAVLVRRGLEAEGIEIGEAESETIASVLIAVCDGLILQWLVDPDRVPSSRQLLAGAGAALAAVSRR